MAKVYPYNTNSQEYPPSHRNVHHDHDDCPDGKRIQSQHREIGTEENRSVTSARNSDRAELDEVVLKERRRPSRPSRQRQRRALLHLR